MDNQEQGNDKQGADGNAIHLNVLPSAATSVDKVLPSGNPTSTAGSTSSAGPASAAKASVNSLFASFLA